MRRVLLLILCAAVAGCERVVAVTVPDSPERLVVEARLERVRGATSGAQRIRLTTTGAYFNRVAPPAARGAVVRVLDDSGAVYPFAESVSEPGIYATSALTVAVGRTYTLRITYRGEEFSATESAMPGVPMDSLFFRSRLYQSGPKTGLRATIAFRDPAGVKNFYLWDQAIDGKVVVSSAPDAYVRPVAADELRDGARIRQEQPFDGVVVLPGQLVTIRQLGISEQTYRYFSALSEQGVNDGSPFGVAPSSLRGNIANLTVPGQVGLGYFLVTEVYELVRRVP